MKYKYFNIRKKIYKYSENLLSELQMIIIIYYVIKNLILFRIKSFKCYNKLNKIRSQIIFQSSVELLAKKCVNITFFNKKYYEL